MTIHCGNIRTCLFAVLGLISLSWWRGGTACAQKSNAILATQSISPIEQAERDGTALRISVRDLTKLALQNNLDIAIQDTNEDLYRQKLIQSYLPYDPSLTVGLGVGSTKSANTNLVNVASAADYNSYDQAYWNVKYTQNIPTGGGITASYNSNRTNTNQQFALFTPQYNSSLMLQVAQPLNRNRRIDQNRGAIQLANLDTRLNDSQFKQSVTTTIATIQSMYWDLVYAVRDFEIKRESLKRAGVHTLKL